MVLSIFKDRAAKTAQLQAKNEYIKAASLSNDSREGRTYKIRIGIRCRAHLDKVFIEGAKKTESYQERCSAAVAKGTDKPAPPKPAIFQKAKTVSGEIFTYVPEEFAQQIFTLGAMYQTVQIDASKAITLAQEVAERVSYDLGLEEPFISLQFLRDEIQALAESVIDDEHDDTGDDQNQEEK
jgi:hypothetical protein